MQPKRILQAELILVLAIALRAGAGCSEDPKQCYPGDYLGCTCADGGLGYAACAPLRDFETSRCVCDGTTPGLDAGRPDAPPDAGAADAPVCVADAGPRQYFEPCAANDECASCQCEDFGPRGKRCTVSCAALDQCPAPADACTNRSFCRPPP